MGGIARTVKEPEVRSEELLDAAQHLFAANGYEKTMIRDIVRKVGVAKGTFYYYFPTKEAALEAIMAVQANKLVESFVNPHAHFSAVEKMKLFIQHLFIPNDIEIIFHKLWEEKQFELFYSVCKTADAILNSFISDIIQQGNREETMHVLLIDDSIAFLWSTLNCLWESIYNKDSAEKFTGKVRIAEAIIESILGLDAGSFRLCILPR